ncbi:MAG TPA: hypothetical protein PK595_00760 [Bacteroidota bacterium]|nr:hypothetical protein [Bacteroidota bacterium]
MASPRVLKSYYIALIVLVIFSVAVLQFPLFNVVGLEFSAAIAPLVGFISGFLLLLYIHSLGGNFQTPSQLRVVYLKNFGGSLLLAFVPLLLGLGNTFIVRNCSILSGIYFYLIILIPTIVLCSALSFFIWALVPKFQKTLYIVFYLLILLLPFLRLLLSPQLYLFSPIIGFFPGFTYDESLPVVSRLLPYRLVTFGAGIFLFAFSLWLWNTKTLLKNRDNSQAHQRRTLPEIIAMSLLGPFVLMMIVSGNRIGFFTSEKYLRTKLGGFYSTEHCDIVYPLGKIRRPTVEQIGKLQEFYYNELADKLKVIPQKRITLFLYANSDQKAHLVGAGSTNFTKPWLYQIHINAGVIEDALKHEMVHVFAGEFGWSPIRLGRSFGLSEGLAVALGDDEWFDEPTDRAAALLLAVQDIDIAKLFSTTGFLSQAPSTGYLLSGSFCKYLVDTFGIDKMKSVFRTNDFERSYHLSLTELTKQWRKQLPQLKISRGDSLKALYFSRRQSPYTKECVRFIASLNRKGQIYFEQQDYERALATADKSMGYYPTAESVLLKVRSLCALRKFDEAVKFGSSMLDDPKWAIALLTIRLWLGDAYFALDSLDAARREYAFLASIHLSKSYDEACAFRLEALSLRYERSEWIKLLTYNLDISEKLQRLTYFPSALARYERGKLYFANSELRNASEEFKKASDLQSPVLQFFRLYYLGRTLETDLRYEEAAEYFSQALLLAPTEGIKTETNNHLKRCIVWSAQNGNITNE